MQCPRCKRENGANRKFCASCGEPLGTPCLHCGFNNDPGDDYCGGCGRPLRPSATPAGPAPKAAEREATPPGVKRREPVRTVLEGEHKQVTILFCDLVNSTAVAERLGPERMHIAMERFFALCLAEVKRYEGTINQYLGDGFMGLFGAPRAYEDHAVRACRAALGIQTTVSKWRSEIGPRGSDLDVRVGLNTGAVVIGRTDKNLPTEFTATGDATNLAARMQQIAGPGDILLGEQTWTAVRQDLDCEALGPRRIKGKSHLVRVFRLAGLRNPSVASEVHLHGSALAPLVARDTEVALLRECLERLRAGSGSIVGVIGEAGIGKSRLLWEIRRVERDGLTWLGGRALSFGKNVSYGPVMEALRNAAGIVPLQDRDQSWRWAERFVTETLEGEATETLPFVGMLMGLELPPLATGLVTRLDPQDVRAQMFTAARRIFQALARKRPVVLGVEDFHWADAMSAALVEHLLPLTETDRLLICFAGRPDPDTPLSGLQAIASRRFPQRYLEVRLAPLSNSDSNRLIDNALSNAQAPAKLRGLILRKAEGNPLFIEEVVRSLRASGMLRRDPVTHALSIVGDLDALDLPDTIEGIIMTVVDRLEDDVKEVLKLASVIGRSFYHRILQALDEAAHQLDDCLEQLNGLELIRQRRLAPEAEYVFKHALVQEATYHSLLADRRRQLHRRAGEAMEKLFADRLDEFASFLAHHYARAEDWNKARAYLLRAGDQAARMAADAEATVHYSEAMDAFTRAFGDQWDAVQHASLERKVGEGLFRLGRHEEACERLYAALALLGARYPRTAAWIRAETLVQMLRQLWYRLRPLQSARERQVTEARLEVVRGYTALAWVDYFRDARRFFLDVIAALNSAERWGITAAVAQGCMGIAVACQELGLSRLALYYHVRAMRLAKSSHDKLAITLATYGVCIHDHLAGNWDRAMRGMERVTRAWRTLGKTREYGLSTAHFVWLLINRGELARAATLIDELLQISDDAKDEQAYLTATLLAAIVGMQKGHLPSAATALENVSEGLKGIPDYQFLCEAYGNRARCALMMGKLEEAAQWLARAGDLMNRQWIRPGDSDSARSVRGWLTLALLERAGLAANGGAMRRMKESIGSLQRLSRVYAGVGPTALCLEGSYAWLCGSRRRALAAWERGKAAAEKLGSRYHFAIILREMGRFTGSVSDVERAAREFQAMGYAFEQARTLRYLGEALTDAAPDPAREAFERALALHKSMSADFERAQTDAAYHRALHRIGNGVEHKSTGHAC